MKKSILTFVLFLGFGCCVTISAQNYNEVSADIQKKMNQNKNNGLAINEGIQVDYELTFEGVTNEKSANELKSLLQQNCNLISFQYNLKNNHIVFTVPAKFNLEGMKPFIKNSKFGFGQFFKEFYHLQK